LLLKQVLNAQRYGYAYARVCAMKSLLLPKSFILSLLRVNSIQEIIEMLERTHYRELLVKYSRKYRGYRLVEVATSQYFANLVKKIASFLHERDRYLYSVVLVKWHASNLKLLLNARMRKREWVDVEDMFMDIGTINKENAKVVVEGKEHDAFKAFISSFFVKEMLKFGLSPVYIEKIFINAEKKPEELVNIKTKIDKMQYAFMLREIENHEELSLLRDVLKKDIDVANLCLIGKFKAQNIDIKQEDFIAGGNLTQNRLFHLANMGMNEFLKEVANIFKITQPKDVLEMEIALKKIIAHARIKTFYRSPLSLGAIIIFPFLQEETIHNIRKIAVGKEFGVEKERIKEVLVL